MRHSMRGWRFGLMTSTVILSASLFSIAAYAFDPEQDANTADPSQLTPVGTTYYPPAISVPLAAGNMAPVAAIQMPTQPLYPERVATPGQAAPVDNTPVASSMEAQPSANEVSDIAADPALAPPVLAGGATVAPMPLDAPAVVDGSPVASPVPVGALPAVAPAPAIVGKAAAEAAHVASVEHPELSDETRRILSHVTGNLDGVKPSSGKLTVDRVRPEIKDMLGNKAKEDAYQSVGLSIKVRRPGLDTNYELNRAYTALMGGDSDQAIEIYKNILGVNANNQEALFGLAATYHRLGNLDKARPLYGALLALNPGNREALNNFLVLVSDESPQEALPELERLEARNPTFSPIPAQIAVVLDKLGYKQEARDKMMRAIDLAPDNLTYKYNLAVMLDQQGQSADAAALYQLLIESSLRGAKVPATVDVMQRRVNYLANNMANRSAALAQPAESVVN